MEEHSWMRRKWGIIGFEAVWMQFTRKCAVRMTMPEEENKARHSMLLSQCAFWCSRCWGWSRECTGCDSKRRFKFLPCLWPPRQNCWDICEIVGWFVSSTFADEVRREQKRGRTRDGHKWQIGSNDAMLASDFMAASVHSHTEWAIVRGENILNTQCHLEYCIWHSQEAEKVPRLWYRYGHEFW